MFKKRDDDDDPITRPTAYGAHDILIHAETQRSRLLLALALSCLGTLLLIYATLSSTWSNLINQHYMANNFRVEAGLFTVTLTSAEPTAGGKTNSIFSHSPSHSPLHFRRHGDAQLLSRVVRFN